VHGAINILWVKTAYSIEDFARRHLADLQAAARETIASLPKARR
jgi:IclR family transcriptional regulator, mhp operon transcriptional activator